MQEINHTDHMDIQRLQPVYYSNGHRYPDDISSNFTNPRTKSFISNTRAIEREIEKIYSNITTIQSMQTQITISTSKIQETSLISSRDSIVDTTKNLLNETKDQIRLLETDDLKIIRSSTTTEDFELRKQRINHLKEKFVACLNTYRDIENLYMKQQKERLSRQYKIVHPDANDDEIEEYLKHPTDQPVFVSSRRVQDSKKVLEEVNQRHHDIKKIERTIAELVELIKEIQLKVEIEEDVIVTINDNVQKVEITTREVTVKLEQAEEIAKNTRSFKWLYALCTLLIFGIIVLITVFVIKRHHG
ncbi:t-SNARE [Glomus cerebriforme]|uniref:t-SNARE n=1 Tax=Glomus cerebriforme TaxID=658196 RepID=A0A397TGT3_9GLOM|nr:t-SNARE [Glomus cerebriforme]